MCAIEAQTVPYPASPRRRGGVPARLATDERLARSVRDGNEAAFSTIYKRYHQSLYRYCRSIIGNDADAQDALQAAFTAALVALRDGRRDAPLRPWLFRIGHNESISLLRRRRPEQELPEEFGSTTGSAHDAAQARARLALLVADLRDLPERQRGALVMRELSGLTHDEIALALGITVGVAKQTVLEARRSLLEFAEGREMPCAEIQQIVSDGDGRTLRGRRVRAHLRECPNCAALAEAIPARRADLLALSPALPAATASGLLARISRAGSGSGGGGGLAGATAGKGVSIAVSAKALLAGAAIVATTAVGAGTVIHRLAASPPASARTAPTALARARRLDSTRQSRRDGAAGASVAGSGSSATKTHRKTSTPARGFVRRPKSHGAAASTSAPISARSSGRTRRNGSAAAAAHSHAGGLGGSRRQSAAKGTGHGHAAGSSSERSGSATHGNAGAAHAKNSRGASGSDTASKAKPFGATGGGSGSSTKGQGKPVQK